MSKIIISEQRLNALINECVEEVMIEEGIAQNVWNGVKKGAQAVGGAFKRFGQHVKSDGLIGAVADAKGAYDQTKRELQKRYQSYLGAAKDRVRAKYVDRDPWNGISGDEREVMARLNGNDENGNNKYNATRLAKALSYRGHNVNQIVQIMTQKGYKGITPEYVQQMLAIGRNEQPQTSDNGEQKTNPDVTQQQAQTNGWGDMENAEYMDEAVNRAVSKAINEVVNELGETGWGKKNLERLGEKRKKQSYQEKKKADMALNSAEEAEHSKKSKDYMGRSMAAFAKASEGEKQINEVGNGLKGQYLLGKVHANRGEESKKLDKELTDTLANQHDWKKARKVRAKRDDLNWRARDAYLTAKYKREDNPNNRGLKQAAMKLSYNAGKNIETLKSKFRGTNKNKKENK